MATYDNIVVVGAGVTGLTTALVLQNSGYNVTVVAKYMPGDEAVDYTSPWAGANYLPVSSANSREANWDAKTFHYLWELAKNVPEAGVHIQKTVLWNRKQDQHTAITDWFKELIAKRPWFADMVPDYRVIPQSELPPPYENGCSFQSMVIDANVYMPWLFSQCEAKDIKFARTELAHIKDAVNLHSSGQKADVVINCTGLMASKLGGVEDKTVYPARGQLCIVRNHFEGLFTTSGSDDGPFETIYVQPRMGGGAVLGGSYQKHDWNGEVDHELAKRIMKRAVELCPSLTGGKGPEGLDVIKHCVGLRPLREGGTRLEKEKIDDFWVVHNYAHGGFGYQCSYGCSLAVADIVKDISNTKEMTPKGISVASG